MKSNSGKRGSTQNSTHKETSHEENLRDADNLRDNKPTGTTDEEFPGYPHYPAKEDIMHPASRMEKIPADPERLTRSGAYLDPKSLDKPVSSSLDTAADTDDELIIVPGTEADVTKDDLLILGDQDLEMDEEESVDTKVLSGEIDENDLDIPGEEMDDRDEEIGEEDEENNYYSLGGDTKDSLEES